MEKQKVAWFWFLQFKQHFLLHLFYTFMTTRPVRTWVILVRFTMFSSNISTEVTKLEQHILTDVNWGRRKRYWAVTHSSKEGTAPHFPWGALCKACYCRERKITLQPILHPACAPCLKLDCIYYSLKWSKKYASTLIFLPMQWNLLKSRCNMLSGHNGVKNT